METVDPAIDNVVAQCCRYGPCCHHGSPLAIRGKRLSPKLKPNHDKRSAAVKNAPTKDDDRAKIGESWRVYRVFLCTHCSYYVFAINT